MTDVKRRRLLQRGERKLELPQTALSLQLDSLTLRIGGILSWSWLLLLAIIVLNVTLRYAFGVGYIEFEEAQWHVYSVGFLVGLSYCVASDSHIRIDVLRNRLPQRIQAWIELYGILLLLLPFVAFVLRYALPYVAQSFASAEVSASPGGLPYRWLIKAALPMAFLLLASAALARLLRVSAFLFGAPTPVAPAVQPRK